MANKLVKLTVLGIASIFIIIIILSVSSKLQNDPLNQKIKQILNSARQKDDIPGLALSYSKGNQTHIYSFYSGYSSLENKTKINQDTLYQTGSISKSFLAGLILKLDADGKLNINNTVGSYITNRTKWNNITIHQLLNHTSGIQRYAATDAFLKKLRESETEPSFSSNELLNYVYNEKPYFKPGEGWHYTNTEYVLLGMIAEKVTNKTIEQNLHQQIFKPLNLSQTTYVDKQIPIDTEQRLALGYNKKNIDVTDNNLSWAKGAGAIISTPHDLVMWCNALFNKKTALPQQQLKELMTTVPEGKNAFSTNEHYGLGIEQTPASDYGQIWFHDGGMPGFSTAFMWIPKYKICLAIAANTDTLNGEKINKIAFRLVDEIISSS